MHFGYYDSAAWTDFEVSPTAQDEWQLLTTGVVAVPETATGIRAKFIIAAAATDGEYFYADDIWLKPIGRHNEHLNNYFDYGTGTQLG